MTLQEKAVELRRRNVRSFDGGKKIEKLCELLSWVQNTIREKFIYFKKFHNPVKSFLKA